MELVYSEIGVEVTRKCNQQCRDFCMRGPKQNVDISFDDIDLLLDQKRNQYVAIHEMLFSGGEPTLNPQAIAYIIDKIVAEKLPIFRVAMVTNGLLYSDLVVEAFEKYSNYFNSVILPEQVKKHPKEMQDFIFSSFLNRGSYICFSNDQYHKPISNEVLDLYYRNGSHIVFSMRGSVSDEDMLHSGYAKEGRSLSLEDNNIRIFSNYVMDLVYLTAKGNLSCYGDGSFEFLDEISQDFSIDDYNLEKFCLENLSSSSRMFPTKHKSKILKKIK